jgi:hypothetical protein
MKAAKRKILPLFWLLVAVFQLLFAARLAPAKSIPGLENRVWKIFPLAAQTHQVSQLQIAEMQRERAPPQVKEASDDVLGPESGVAQQEFELFALLKGRLLRETSTKQIPIGPTVELLLTFRA